MSNELKQFEIGKVIKIYCGNVKCKELMVKIYPWSSILPTAPIIEGKGPLCKKCAKENYLKNYKK